MKYKRQLMLQDPKLAEEFEANEIHEEEDDFSGDETTEMSSSSSKTIERLTRTKRKSKVKENKCTSHSCGSMKHSDPWTIDQLERDSSTTKINILNTIKEENSSEKIMEMTAETSLQACSTSPKLNKIEQISPTLIDDWANPSASSTTTTTTATMITPPPTSSTTTTTTSTTTTSCESINCSCCDYDGHFYPSTNSSYSSYPSTTTVNVPVVANFQVNVNTHHHGYPLSNAEHQQHQQQQQQQQQQHHQQQQQQPMYHSISRKTNMYYQQISPTSYYRTATYSPTMKYHQGQVPMYHQQNIGNYSSNSTYYENPPSQQPQQHFPMSSSHPQSQEFAYGYRHGSHPHTMSYNSPHPSSGHVYHQL